MNYLRLYFINLDKLNIILQTSIDNVTIFHQQNNLRLFVYLTNVVEICVQTS